MRTSWQVYDYPAPDDNLKTIKGVICVSYKFETEVPKDWDEERIRQDIYENTRDYTENIDEIDDIEITDGGY